MSGKSGSHRTPPRIVPYLGLLLCFALLVTSPQMILAQPPGELVEQARQAAREDRNEEAAALFERALEEDPGLRGEILREYADQLTFISRAAQAVELFREILAGDPSGLERERAERGLALAYLWSGRYDEAATAWEAILADDPQDDDARGNLLRALTNLARNAAGEDRNERAADFFARAIAVAPGRPASLLLDYADQLTFSGRATRAVPLYDEAIDSGELSGEDELRARRGRALAYLWSGNYQAAINAWEGILSRDRADDDARGNLANALVGAARSAAADDRNRQSADLFERAIATSPARRSEFLLEYAAQLTFSDRADRAVPLYREALANERLTGDARREAMLGLGLALTWSGQLEEALGTYDALIDIDPRDVDAWLGRGRALSWLGRNRRALIAFEQAAELTPGNPEAIRGAAQAQTNLGFHRRAAAGLAPLTVDEEDPEALLIAARAAFWMGRPDRARRLAERVIEQRPQDEGAREVLENVARNTRPVTDIGGFVSTQNDGLVISSSRNRQSFAFNDGLTTFGLQHALTHMAPKDGEAVLINGLGAFGRHRFNDAFELNASFLLNHRSGRGGNRFEATYDTWLTFWPDDVFRFDVSAGRSYFDDIRSVSGGIALDTLGFSVDFRPDPDLRLTARSSYGFISDGNRRLFGQLEAEGRVLQAPMLYLGGRYTHFNFSRPDLDNGYFNPDWLHSAEATARLQATPAPDWTIFASGSAGYEWQPGESKPIWGASIGATYAPNDRISLRGEIRHQDSSGGFGRDGFRRTTFSGGLQVRW